jgi:hypothetical protein
MARVLAPLLVLTSFAFANEKQCVPFEQALEHVGKNTCVSGKVLKVAESQYGSLFLDFCEDYRKCPFTVVVFRRDLGSVGDVRALEGQTIEIHGKIKKYRGRAEIILEDARQLEGEIAKLPPIPKSYDADRRGRFSAGKFDAPRSKHPTRKRSTSTLPDDDIDAE